MHPSLQPSFASFKSACLSIMIEAFAVNNFTMRTKLSRLSPPSGKVTSQKRNRESIRVGFARNLTKDEVCHSNV